MNFKQFISGVSAFAVATSTFAGMVISANAAEDIEKTVSPVYDGYVTSENDNTGINLTDGTYFDDEELHFRKWYQGSAKFADMGILKFDISDKTPDGYYLAKAELTIAVKRTAGTPALSVGAIPKLSNDWTNETLTVDEVRSATGNDNPVGIGGANLGDAYADAKIDVTKAFTEQDRDGIVTLGLWTNGSTAVAASSENSTQTKPSLKLTYSEKKPVQSITVEYKSGDDTIKTTSVDVSDKVTGDLFTYTSDNYVKDTSGNYYYVAADYSESATWKSGNVKVNGQLEKTISSLQLKNTITYNVTPAPNIVYYAEAETVLKAKNDWASTWTGDRWVASGGKLGGTYTAGLPLYDIPATGEYQVVLVTRSNGRGTAIYATKEAAAAGGNDYILKNTNENNSSSGYVVVGTKTLQKGDKITIKGSVTNNATDDIDYIVIRQLSVTEPEVESKGFTFDADLDSLGEKTLKVTIDGETKSLSMSEIMGTATSGGGDILLGLVITNIADTAKSVSAVIE